MENSGAPGDGPPSGEAPGLQTPGPGRRSRDPLGSARRGPRAGGLDERQGARRARSGAACGGARGGRPAAAHTASQRPWSGKPSRAPEAAGRPEGLQEAFGGGRRLRAPCSWCVVWTHPGQPPELRDSPARLQPELAAGNAHRKALRSLGTPFNFSPPGPRSPGAPPQPRVPTARGSGPARGSQHHNLGAGAGSPSQAQGPHPREAMGFEPKQIQRVLN